MRLLRFLLILLYATYLAYAGLIFLLLPWSELWAMALDKLPAGLAFPLDSPALRGLLSAFGLLHFILALSEIRIRPQHTAEPNSGSCGANYGAGPAHDSPDGD